MFCKNCGKKINERAQFCENCGISVIDIENVPEIGVSQVSKDSRLKNITHENSEIPISKRIVLAYWREIIFYGFLYLLSRKFLRLGCSLIIFFHVSGLVFNQINKTIATN